MRADATGPRAGIGGEERGEADRTDPTTRAGASAENGAGPRESTGVTPPDDRPCAPRQRRRGPALLAAIHAATLAELADVGVDALTMEGVAQRAGAGKASLYKRWANTEELVLAALAASDASFDADRERLATTSPFDLRDALVEVLALFSEGLDTPVGRALPVLQAGRERHPALLARVREVMVSPRAAVLRAVLDRAVAQGAMPAENVTPWTIGAGPRLVIAQHKDTGAVTAADVEAIVDQILLPALLRSAPATQN